MSANASDGQMAATLAALEQRVAALEAEVAGLKQEGVQRAAAPKPWWEEIRSTFKNDASYEEAMRLGREYRELFRPKRDGISRGELR